MNQKTIRTPVQVEGVGLHSGRSVHVTISPGLPNSGIVFRVSGHAERIPAAPESVSNSHYATTIGRNGTRIQTVEHLMAAAAGLGIDNLEVEVEGGEIPALDGSAKPFVTLLASAGRAQQPAARRAIVLPYAVRVGDERRWIEITPGPVFSITYTLHNDHPAIGRQELSWTPSEKGFIEEFASARTYGFLKDVGQMRRNGLARGGSLENAIVLGKRGPINGLRYPDEFVRHKILDLIGDLALLSRPVIGHVSAFNAGHALNVQLVQEIQRALGLERRAVSPVEAGVSFAPAPPLTDGFGPNPGLARV
jgi:UDP-3-O-[3-hydroxymyristoyl] N-acetylglucosamine deacetylase